jgi:hypothetical protein
MEFRNFTQNTMRFLVTRKWILGMWQLVWISGNGNQYNSLKDKKFIQNRLTVKKVNKTHQNFENFEFWMKFNEIS